MTRRQTRIARQWLIADHRLADGLWNAVRKLPRGSGIIVIYRGLAKRDRAKLLGKLRRQANLRNLTIIDERSGKAARIHNVRELRRAGLGRVPLLLLSPIFPTSSHPDWDPLPRMRAATLARQSAVPVIALGGMDERRFRRIEKLGFRGWAGIDAFRT